MQLRAIVAIAAIIAMTGCAHQRNSSGEIVKDGRTFKWESSSLEEVDPMDPVWRFETKNQTYTITFPDGTSITTKPDDDTERAGEEVDELIDDWIDRHPREQVIIPGQSGTVAGPPQSPLEVPYVGLPETKDSN